MSQPSRKMNRQLTTRAVIQEPILVKPAGRESNRPDNLYLVDNRNYKLNPNVPQWKRWFFENVWMKLARFVYLKLKLPVPDGADKNGDIFWLEHERICFDEWQARQEMEKFPMPILHYLPVTYSSPVGTECTCVDMPKSDVANKYRRNGHSTVEFSRVDVVRLAGKIAQSDQLVEQYRLKAT